MKGIIELTPFQLALAYLSVLVVILILQKRSIRKEKEVLIASIRMTLQLILTGFVLTFIFENPHPLLTFGFLAVMETFAVYTVFKKFKGKLQPALKRVIALSLIAGTVGSLLYFLWVVVRIDPWYDPQYFIPIAGMLIGNSMTGISLSVQSLVRSMTERRAYVEEALILGATPKKAVDEIVNSTFDAAILPTINSMIGMGIVFLPGMMTGQILSGTSPQTAVLYQAAIMLGILGAVSLSVISLLVFGTRTFFNDQAQLIDVSAPEKGR